MEIQRNTWQQGMDAHKKHLQASSIAYQIKGHREYDALKALQ